MYILSEQKSYISMRLNGEKSNFYISGQYFNMLGISVAFMFIPMIKFHKQCVRMQLTWKARA